VTVTAFRHDPRPLNCNARQKPQAESANFIHVLLFGLPSSDIDLDLRLKIRLRDRLAFLDQNANQDECGDFRERPWKSQINAVEDDILRSPEVVS